MRAHAGIIYLLPKCFIPGPLLCTLYAFFNILFTYTSYTCIDGNTSQNRNTFALKCKQYPDR